MKFSKINLVVGLISFRILTACGEADETVSLERSELVSDYNKMKIWRLGEYVFKDGIRWAIADRCADLKACERYSEKTKEFIASSIEIGPVSCEDIETEFLSAKKCSFVLRGSNSNQTIDCNIELHEMIGQHNSYLNYEKPVRDPGIHKSSRPRMVNSLECSKSIATFF